MLSFDEGVARLQYELETLPDSRTLVLQMFNNWTTQGRVLLLNLETPRIEVYVRRVTEHSKENPQSFTMKSRNGHVLRIERPTLRNFWPTLNKYDVEILAGAPLDEAFVVVFAGVLKSRSFEHFTVRSYDSDWATAVANAAIMAKLEVPKVSVEGGFEKPPTPKQIYDHSRRRLPNPFRPLRTDAEPIAETTSRRYAHIYPGKANPLFAAPAEGELLHKFSTL